MYIHIIPILLVLCYLLHVVILVLIYQKLNIPSYVHLSYTLSFYFSYLIFSALISINEPNLNKFE